MQPRQPESTIIIPGLREKERLWMEPISERVDPLANLNPLGLCADCVRPAFVRCPDDLGRCRLHARQLAKAITVRANAARHCSTPAQRTARAKRRKARKAAKR